MIFLVFAFVAICVVGIALCISGGISVIKSTSGPRKVIAIVGFLGMLSTVIAMIVDMSNAR